MKLQKKNLRPAETGSWGLRNHIHDTEVRGEIPSADEEAAASCPEDLVKIVNKTDYTKHWIFNVNKTDL